MVAYSFKKRFSPRIEDGTKIGTIRGERKRHARVGEPVQLYEAMRTKYCRKIIPDPICVAVKPIRFEIKEREFVVVGSGGGMFVAFGQEPAFHPRFDVFARSDGFDDMADMHAFWLKEHGTGVFRGVWILWAELHDQHIRELAA